MPENIVRTFYTLTLHHYTPFIPFEACFEWSWLHLLYYSCKRHISNNFVRNFGKFYMCLPCTLGKLMDFTNDHRQYEIKGPIWNSKDIVHGQSLSRQIFCHRQYKIKVQMVCFVATRKFDQTGRIFKPTGNKICPKCKPGQTGPDKQRS